MTTLTDDLQKLKALKIKEKELEATFEEAKAARKSFEYSCMRRMEEEGDVKSVKADGTSFSKKDTIFHTISNKELFLEWAAQNDEALLEQKPRATLLNQVVRTLLDDGEPLPPGLGFHVREYISIR